MHELSEKLIDEWCECVWYTFKCVDVYIYMFNLNFNLWFFFCHKRVIINRVVYVKFNRFCHKIQQFQIHFCLLLDHISFYHCPISLRFLSFLWTIFHFYNFNLRNVIQTPTTRAVIVIAGAQFTMIPLSPEDTEQFKVHIVCPDARYYPSDKRAVACNFAVEPVCAHTTTSLAPTVSLPCKPSAINSSEKSSRMRCHHHNSGRQ